MRLPFSLTDAAVTMASFIDFCTQLHLAPYPTYSLLSSYERSRHSNGPRSTATTPTAGSAPSRSTATRSSAAQLLPT